MFLEVFLGIIFCIGIYLWWWQYSSKVYWKKNGVSYIPGPPLVGVMKDAAMFKKNIGDLLYEIYNHEEFKDDPITGVYFFHKPSLVVRDPEIIKNILIRDFQHFVNRNLETDPVSDGIGSNNLGALRGDKWRTVRQKLTPLFTSGKIKNIFHLIMDVRKTLENKLTMEIGNKPREYDIKKHIASLFSTDALTIFALGVKANSLLKPNEEFHKNAEKMFEFNWNRAIQLSTSFLFPELAKFLGFTFFPKETNDFLRSSVNHVMTERTKSGEKRKDLIDVLIEMKNENPEYFDEDTLIGQAGAFLAAGYESSSTTTAYALFELAHRPEIQEKLRKEIKDYDAKYGTLNYDTINELVYLNCVIKETLRFYSIAPFLDRVCLPADGSDSYSLEPYHKFAIPRGMPVYIPIFGIHQDPKYFKNPSEFLPERFSPENLNANNQYNFLSFGLGPRNCIGSKFGMLQVQAVLYTILRNYRVEASENTPKIIEFDKKSFFSHSKYPLLMNLTRI